MILLVSATAGSDDAGIAAAPAMTELVIAQRVMCVAMIRGPPVASVMVRGRHGCTRGGLSVCPLDARGKMHPGMSHPCCIELPGLNWEPLKRNYCCNIGVACNMKKQGSPRCAVTS